MSDSHDRTTGRNLLISILMNAVINMGMEQGCSEVVSSLGYVVDKF